MFIKQDGGRGSIYGGDGEEIKRGSRGFVVNAVLVARRYRHGRLRCGSKMRDTLVRLRNCGFKRYMAYFETSSHT
jgi:hypothetical protein